MIVPSALVSRVSSPVIAVALVETLPSVVVRLDCSDVISELFDVIVPSALVTRVSKPDIAVEFALMLP